MKGLKQTLLCAVASAAFLCLPAAPAAAHGYGYGGPCIVGNVIGAVATLVTLPLVVASAAVSALQPQPYAAAPGYYGAPVAYSAPPAYYAPPPAYYARAPAYYAPPPGYYRPAPAYAAAPPRGYYAARPGYSGAYGAPGRSGYRGW